MSIQGIRAGKAFVEFFIDDKALNSGLGKISKQLSEWGQTGLKATTPILAAFAGAAATFASVGSELNDLSERTGLSVESLSELKFAAQQTGTDMGVVEKAVKELQKNGIDPLNFDKIAADLSAIPDHTERAKKAIEIFGAKSGTQLLPLLKDLPQLREQARELGVVMSTDSAHAADALGDAWDASKAQLVALTTQIGGAIAGPLTQFFQWSQGVVANVIAWVRENPRLIATIAAVTLGVAAASAALATFGIIMAIISAHPIVAALSLIAGAILGIATYFGLATDGAGEFRKKLDGIKTPSLPQTQAINAQASQIQTQLQNVQAGGNALQPAVSPRSESAAVAISSKAEAYLAAIEAHTKLMADTLLRRTFGVKAAAL